MTNYFIILLIITDLVMNLQYLKHTTSSIQAIGLQCTDYVINLEKQKDKDGN